MKDPKQKILVIRFSSLGDIILMLPMARALRDGFPDAAIDLATKKEYEELASGFGCFDRIHTLESPDLSGLFRMARRLRKERYDIVIDAHGVIRSRALGMLMPGARKIRIFKDQARKTLLIKGSSNLYGEIKTQIERYLDLTRRLGINVPPRHVTLKIPGEQTSRAESLLQTFKSRNITVAAVAPGARYETKRWNERGFAEVIEGLTEMKLGVVIIGDSSERALAERIASDTGAMNLAGELSVLETAAVLSRCALLVTNDSAPLHLAEAVGTPVIAIFGPTVREFGFYPSLEESIVLEKDVACRPCSRNGSTECKKQVRGCLEGITADDVIEAAGKILAGSGSKT